MKKTLIAIALAAMIAPAWGAEVVSSNIVGYQKITLATGLNMIGAQFLQVGGENQTMNGFVDAAGQPSYNEDFDPQTELRIWTGNGYDTFGWSGNLSTDCSDLADELGATGTELDNQWLNMDYEAAEDVLEPSAGFWIKAGASGTVCLSGEVPETGTTVSVNLAAGLNMVSYPWPAKADFGNIAVPGQPSYNEDFDPQTEIRIWTGNGYDTYGWSGSLSTECPDLADELGATGTELDNKWLDMDYEVPEDPIPAGTAFWIKAAKAGTVQFSF